MSERSVRLALQEHGGNVSAVADAFGRSRQTVYNWIQRYALRDMVDLSRDTMFATAEANINLAVQAGNLEASKFVLTHMPVEGRWSSRNELTGKDGKDLFDDELRAAMQALGIDQRAVVAEFRALMLAEAEQRKAAAE